MVHSTPSDVQNRVTSIKRVLWIVLVLNYMVCMLKLSVGTVAHSASMVADGLHSLADGSSNIVGLIGIHMASHPADIDHPYGHGKYEAFTALGISVTLMVIAWEVLKSTWFRFFNPVVPQVGLVQFLVMLVTMGINTAVTCYERAQGRQWDSVVLASDAAHTLTDIYVSLSVLVSLVAVRLGYPAVDLIISLVIALLIMRTALEIVTMSTRILCDAAVLDAVEVDAVVRSVDGVKGCHNIRTRGRSDQAFIDLHIEVDSPMDIEGAHALSHRVEQTLRERFHNLHDTLIHIEPVIRPTQGS